MGETGTISRLIFKIREWDKIYFSRILVKERNKERNRFEFSRGIRISSKAASVNGFDR